MINILEFLKRATKPQSNKDLRKAGFTNIKEELKRLQKLGLIVRNEEYSHNTIKKYMNKETGKLETYAGTRFYTYSVAQAQ
jgi:predicted transcriptional regulator